MPKISCKTMTPAPDPRCRLGMERPPFQEDGRLLLGNASRGGLVAREVLVLRSRWQRMRLAWFRRLGPGQALLIGAPAVHSLGARHAFRVVHIDGEDRVLGEVLLPRWRSAAAPGNAPWSLMLHTDNPAVLRAGDRLEWLLPQPRMPERADWLVEGQPPDSGV